MKRLTLTLLILTAIVCPLFSQAITGFLTDEKGTALEYANVMLLSAKDSSFICGCITDPSGKFTLPDAKADKGYLLKFSYVGYEDLFYTPHEENVGTIVMKSASTSLDNVVVTASKPVFRQKKDALVTDVAGSVLAESHKITDVLSQIPGMIQTPDGQLEVFGLGEPIIYINNKKVQNKTEIQQLSPKNIKSIELITNPGAKYDASGKSVLKIITLKKEDGWNLQLEGEGGIHDYPFYSGLGNLGVKYGKLSLSASYNYTDYRTEENQPQIKQVTDNNIIHSYEQDQTGKDRQKNQSWMLNLDYEINSKHNFGISWDGSKYKDNDRRSSLLSYRKNNTLSQESLVELDYRTLTKFNHLNAFYNGTWNEHLTSTVNLDYVKNNNRSHQQANEKANGVLQQTLSLTNGIFNIYAGKADLGYTLPKGEISVGAEYNHVDGKGNLTSESTSVSPSDYTETEKKYAVYAETSFTFGNWSIGGGVRYEAMASDYKEYLNPKENINRNYKDVFPSLMVSYNRNGWNNSLSFSSHTTRPSFWQLSSASYYINEFMSQQGNSLLQPENSYSLQWSTSYKIVNFSASYTYTDNYIAGYIYSPENGRNKIIASYKNYDKMQSLKADLNIQKNIAWWKPSLSVGIIQPFFKTTYLNQEINNNKINFYITLDQHVQFPNSYLLSVYYHYTNGGNTGIHLFKPYQTLNISLQKKLLKDRLSISINAQDIFRTLKHETETKIGNIYVHQTEDYNPWYYSLSISYKLNSIAPKYRGKSSIEDDINRL